MKLPSDFERKEWWFFIYAHTSFEKSLECCDLIQAHADSTRHPLYLPLATAMHAFYGRPFKKIQGISAKKKGDIGPELPADFVPDEFAGLHEAIIAFRDKILVHTDANDVPEAGRPLHDVVYTVHPFSDEFSTNDPRPTLDHYECAAVLLKKLREKAFSKIESFHGRFAHLVPRMTGNYLFNLTGLPLFTTYQEPSRIITFGRGFDSITGA